MAMRFMSVAVLLAFALAGGAKASDLYPPMQPAPAYNPAAFQFEGLYLGAYLGAGLSSGSTNGTLGGVVGVNFAVADPVMAGGEIQGGVYGANGSTAYDFLALGHLGVLLTDSVLAYGALGAGVNSVGTTKGVWAAGGGVDFAVTDSLSARGEALYTHPMSGSGDATKVTAGLLWHIQ